jgi:signal transduction histidine kinase
MQVFLNLGRNSLQALEGEGTLWIETRMALEHRLAAPDGATLQTVLVTVADDGPGIEPAVLDRLGTPFFTTRSRGTGLGLAVSLHWVSRHGGELRVESEPGQGTRVRVGLPVTGPPQEVAA